MVAIIDYGVGNLGSIANMLKKIGVEFQIYREVQDLENATHIILPGVGSFDRGMAQLNNSGWRDVLDKVVAGQSKPLLGICLGMQLMTAKSEEGRLPGLGWFRAEARKFGHNQPSFNLRVPHMGWNDVVPRNGRLFKDLERGARFYFVHSYYVHCHEAENILATTDYGEPFCSAIQKGTIFGVQFHPEKSHRFGIQLLKNFCEITSC